MSCYCDTEAPSVFASATPKAKKAHRCCECNGVIQPGETYQRYWGVWDGEAATYRICSDCNEAAKWYTSLVKCFGDCRSFGSLHSDMYEDATEHDHEVRGFLMEVAERLDAIRAKRGAKPLGYVSHTKEMYRDRDLDADQPTA